VSEVERWMPARIEVFHVDWEEEGEAEEGENNEVDQTDTDGWCGDRWTERTEVVHGEFDPGGYRLRCGGEVKIGWGGAAEKVCQPFPAEGRDYVLLEDGETRIDVRCGSRLVACRIVNDLTCASRVVGLVPISYSIGNGSCRIRIDNHSSPGVKFVHASSYVERVIIEVGGWADRVSGMAGSRVEEGLD